MKSTENNRGTYVASRVHHAKIWRELRAEGYRINSTWIDEAGQGETPDMSRLWSRIAREVASSSRFVLYIEPYDFPLKGALVEAGIALANLIPIMIVAPRVKLDKSFRPIGSWMCHHMVHSYDSIEDAMEGADICM